MSDLEDTFGPDFAEHVEQRVQERRQERERINDQTRKEIADKAINGGAFHEGDPTFEYTSENGITHNVLLMKLAEPREGTVWQMVRQLDSGAVSLPLDYLGEWIWSIFNDAEEAKKMEPGEWYIVVGNLSTWEPDDGEPRDQLGPVRGVISLDEAKKLANKSMDDAGFGSSEEEDDSEEEEADETPPGFGDSSDDDDDEDEEESPKGGIFGSSDDDEEEEDESEDDEGGLTIDATYSEIANVVEDLGDEEPEVWEVTEDHEDFDTFIMVIMDKLGLDYDNENARSEVAEVALDRVDEGPREDDSGDDTDSLF